MTTELDRLPPDQRAVLSLVLERGKSYGEVADMLAIPESAVRDRAHAALDALANDPHQRQPSHPSSVAVSPTIGSIQAPPPRQRTPRPPRTPASSRTGGALLLGGILVVVIVAVILITGSSGKGSSHSSTKAGTTKSTSTASTAAPKLDKKIALTPTDPTLKATGLTYVFSEGSRRAFYVQAQGLPPTSGFFYAVWLYNSPSNSTPLGRVSTANSSGHVEGGNPLPTNAVNYHQVIITRETSTRATRPGTIVMSGPFAVH
jgi:Anti-sigma-K factor rskA/Sigma-70, region 4